MLIWRTAKANSFFLHENKYRILQNNNSIIIAIYYSLAIHIQSWVEVLAIHAQSWVGPQSLGFRLLIHVSMV